MSKAVILAVSAAVALECACAPHFVTPAMIKRHGLTDEQYETLWAMGANPRIDSSSARAWAFNAQRGQNLMEWIGDTMSETGIAEKVAVTLETNKALVARNTALERRCTSLESRVDQLMAQCASLSKRNEELAAANEVLQQRYAETKPNAMLAVRVQDALRAEGTLGPYLRNELVSLLNSTSDPKKREVFDACIGLIDSVVNAVPEAAR